MIRQNATQRSETQIGIPDILPGWEVPITEYFTEPGKLAIYDYDYGDGWSHYVLLEGILLKEHGVKYPKCIGGERACPPEDCGGVDGYYQVLKILSDPNHPEYHEYKE